MEEPPLVPIGIGKVVLVHEPVILRLPLGRATGAQGFRHQSIDFLAARTAQGEQHFAARLRVADRLGRETGELRVGPQHDMNDITDDDARTRVIGELGIVVKAQRLVEGHGLGQIRHRQADEDESTHEKDGFED